MKKMLLIAAAALAASVISSEAQVYSQNIVGYVNVPVQPGYNLIANPLVAGSTNGANEVITTNFLNDGDTFVIWNGAGFNQVLYSPFFQGIYSQPSPWLDPNSFSSTAVPTISPGKGFFYYNAGSSNSITFTGTVAIQTGATNTMNLVAGYNMISSVLPITANVTNAAFNLNPADGDTLVLWTGSTYNQVLYSPFFQGIYSQPSPWLDPNSFNSVTPPTVTSGQGFFYYSSGVNTWTQTLQ